MMMEQTFNSRLHIRKVGKRNDNDNDFFFCSFFFSDMNHKRRHRSEDCSPEVCVTLLCRWERPNNTKELFFNRVVDPLLVFS